MQAVISYTCLSKLGSTSFRNDDQHVFDNYSVIEFHNLLSSLAPKLFLCVCNCNGRVYDSQTQIKYKKDNSRKNKVNSTENLVKTTTEKKNVLP